jgi:tetratricopeptide (TPR) repeat protein
MRRSGLLLILAAVPVLAAGPGRDEGVRLFEAQRYPEARAALEAALRQDAADGIAAGYLGRVYYEENDLERAVAWLEKAVALKPDSSPNVYWLGRAYGQQAIRGNVFVRARVAGKVRHAFARAVELDPANMDARFGLLEFYLQAPGLMGGSLEKARVQAKEIGEHDPMRGHRALARVHEEEKRPDLASIEYEKAVRDFPSRSEPFFWIEWSAIGRRDWPAAFSAIDRYLAAFPDDAGPLYEIGKLAALSGLQLARGESCLRRYLEHTPTGSEPSIAMAHADLAAIHEHRGERKQAHEEYSAALRLDPGLREATEGILRVR